MLSYKDMTFCAYTDCKFFKYNDPYKQCFRALTKKVIEDANKLNLPICQFADKPECFKDKNGK